MIEAVVKELGKQLRDEASDRGVSSLKAEHLETRMNDIGTMCRAFLGDGPKAPPAELVEHIIDRARDAEARCLRRVQQVEAIQLLGVSVDEVGTGDEVVSVVERIVTRMLAAESRAKILTEACDSLRAQLRGADENHQRAINAYQQARKELDACAPLPGEWDESGSEQAFLDTMSTTLLTLQESGREDAKAVAACLARLLEMVQGWQKASETWETTARVVGERSDATAEVPARCTHEGIGKPGCIICDARLRIPDWVKGLVDRFEDCKVELEVVDTDVVILRCTRRGKVHFTSMHNSAYFRAPDKEWREVLTRAGLVSEIAKEAADVA